MAFDPCSYLINNHIFPLTYTKHIVRGKCLLQVLNDYLITNITSLWLAADWKTDWKLKLQNV